MELAQMTKHEGGRYHDGEMFLPWYTSPCLEWLVRLDLRDKFVFEYGLGDSTKWYESQGAKTYGVDNNLKWIPRFDDGSPICGFYYSDVKDRYVKGWTGIFGSIYDIVIVDGLWRDECTRFALQMLKPGGYLIIDNFHQPSVEEHWPLTDALIEGMPITIYKEPDHYDWQTVVITKP